MSETVKINLSKVLTILSICSVVGGLIWGTAVVYAGLDGRIDDVEKKQEKFEGVMEERTRNMNENINRIYDIVKEWEKE